jgi:hypothetical protein
MAQVNILLGVLTIEVDIVCRFALSGASHAYVSVWDIKSTRVASVPVGETLCDIGVWHLLNVCIHSASNAVARWTCSRRGMVRGLCHGYRGNYVTSRWPAGKTKLGAGLEETRGMCWRKSPNMGKATTRVVSVTADGIHWRTASSATQGAYMFTHLPSRVPPDATAFIADVERDGIQRSNVVMHVLVHQILLHCNLCHLTVVVLARIVDVG